MAPLTPFPLASKWTLSFCVCCVTEVGPSGSGPSLNTLLHPAPASSGSPFGLWAPLARPLGRTKCKPFRAHAASRGSKGLAQRGTPGPARPHRGTATTRWRCRLRKGGVGRVFTLTLSSCRGKASQSGSLYTQKWASTPLSTPTDERVTCLSPQGALSSYSVVFQDRLAWLHFHFL